MRIADLLSKSRNEEKLSQDELVYLLGLPPDTAETYLVMAEANRISKELTDNRAEIHAQLALNLAPCPCNCMFCSFVRVNGVFDEETRPQSTLHIAVLPAGSASRAPKWLKMA